MLKTKISNATTRSWISNGSLALIDQGIFAATNFSVNIALARWLTEESYGQFVFVYAIYVFLLGAHSSLILEPLNVFGAGRFSTELQRYFATWKSWHKKAGVPIIIVCLSASYLIALIRPSSSLATLAAMSLLVPLSYWMWLLRRSCYVELKIGRAVVMSATYSTLLAGLLIALLMTNRLSPSFVFLAMSLATIIATALYSSVFAVDNNLKIERLEVWSLHWHFGSWGLATTAVIWLSSNVYYLFLPNAAIAELRAWLNFAVPASQFLFALSPLLLTKFSRNVLKGNFQGLRQSLLLMTAIIFACCSILFITLSVYGDRLFVLLYGAKYDEALSYLPLVAAMVFVQGVASIYENGLRALEMPRYSFNGYVVRCAATLLIGVPISLRLGAPGAIWTQILSYSLAAVVISAAFFYWFSSTKPNVSERN